MLVCGTERMLLYDDTDEAQPVKVFNWSLDYRGSLGRVAAECDYDNVYAPPMDRAEPLARMAAHFIACASTGARPVTDGAAGLRVVRTLEAARSSLAAGGEAVMLSG